MEGKRRVEARASAEVCVTGPENLEAGCFPAPMLWCPRRGTPREKAFD